MVNEPLDYDSTRKVKWNPRIWFILFGCSALVFVCSVAGEWMIGRDFIHLQGDAVQSAVIGIGCAGYLGLGGMALFALFCVVDWIVFTMNKQHFGKD